MNRFIYENGTYNDAARWQKLMKLIGDPRDGSDTIVRLFWDDVTNTSFIKIGVDSPGTQSEVYFAKSFEQAIDSIPDPSQLPSDSSGLVEMENPVYMGYVNEIKFNVRPNTQDQFIINEVFHENCYQLSDDLSDYVVIDVGANVGAFVAACVVRGCENIFAFEPEPGNFNQLWKFSIKNELWKLGGVKLSPYAVHGKTTSNVFYIKSNYHQSPSNESCLLTGGCSISFARSYGSVPVETTGIIDLLKFIRLQPNCNNKKILLKLDCEGSEHTIVKAMLRNGYDPEFFPSMILGEVHTTLYGKMSENGPVGIPHLPSHQDFINDLWNLGYYHSRSGLRVNPHDPRLALFRMAHIRDY